MHAKWPLRASSLTDTPSPPPPTTQAVIYRLLTFRGRHSTCHNKHAARHAHACTNTHAQVEKNFVACIKNDARPGIEEQKEEQQNYGDFVDLVETLERSRCVSVWL